jgi:energy-coupling factor transport system ATP-binding protein
VTEIIKFDAVSYSYQAAAGDTPSPALDGVTLSVGQGEMVAILGHNGSGKSTLAKMLNGLLTPLSGTVTVCGMDTQDEELLIGIRQKVGLVFQNPDNQIVATVVEEDVAFALENLGVPPDEMRVRVDSALNEVGMSEYKEHAPHRLSGGQKQRVAIAGALAMTPVVLAMDEPTAMLDPKGRVEVMETVKRLNGRGVTVIMVTHHMDEAALCSRVVVMDRGKVVMDGTPGEVFARPKELQDLGLTVPQTVALAQGLGIDAVPLTEEECAEVIYKSIQDTGSVTV